MAFLWPKALWLLAALPLLAATYFWALARRKKLALRYSNLSIVREAMRGQGWKRHVPPALFLAAMAGMLLAAARPAAIVTLPSEHETVILAMDVSGSMKAEDVKPSRLAASQAAARAFINDTPRSTRIGIVAFAGSASLAQAPTANRDDALAAIEQFQLQHATAIGSGILVSLKAIFPDVEFDAFNFEPKTVSAPVKPGSYAAAAVILLSDGQTTTGPDPIEAARVAAGHGVRVFTVGVGTPEGEILTGEGWSIRVRLDEDSLKQIAELTGAEYFHAGTAADLKKVYRALNSKLVMEKRETEVTALFAVAAALFAVVSAALSLLWFNRIV
ncbi:MAG: VWA domain-containing protein [Betaproteobacteria bacterium]